MSVLHWLPWSRPSKNYSKLWSLAWDMTVTSLLYRYRTPLILKESVNLSGLILRILKWTHRLLCWGYQWDHMFEISSQMDKFWGVLIFYFFHLPGWPYDVTAPRWIKYSTKWRTYFLCPAPSYINYILYEKAMFQIWRSSTKVWKSSNYQIKPGLM